MASDADAPIEDESSDLGVWPTDRPSPYAGLGIVPIGTPVLHSAAKPIQEIDGRVAKIAGYMIRAMHARRGIGLAANQVGIAERLFVTNLSRCAPDVLINPVILHSEGSWSYSEGCLSVRIEGTGSVVYRPKRITIEAWTLKHTRVEIEADEVLARVFQHEIDHLDGIEYVQRLHGIDRKRVYDTMKAAGVDVSWVPPID